MSRRYAAPYREMLHSGGATTWSRSDPATPATGIPMSTGGGYLTILPDKGNHVDGLLWKVSAQDEQALNHYEGFPHFYARRTVDVQGKGVGHQAMVYVMNAPYKDEPERPSRYYWNTVLEGCRQNGIPMQPMLEAWREAAQACRPQKHRDTFESPDR